MTTHELKPCPFCGKPPLVFHVSGYDDSVRCNCINMEDINMKAWNSADCWKEIDRLKAENKRSREVLKKIADMDYRWNRPEASGIAHDALLWWECNLTK